MRKGLSDDVSTWKSTLSWLSRTLSPSLVRWVCSSLPVTWQPIRRLLRMLATRIIRHVLPSCWATTAFWLNLMVSARFLGRAILARKVPVMKISMMVVRTSWVMSSTMASGHSSLM